MAWECPFLAAGVPGYYYVVNCDTGQWVRIEHFAERPFVGCCDSPQAGCVEVEDEAEEELEDEEGNGDQEQQDEDQSWGASSSSGGHFTILPRGARFPGEVPGEVEQLDAVDVELLADDTGRSHLVRLFLVRVDLPGHDKCFLPAGFEIAGHDSRGPHTPTAACLAGEFPAYNVVYKGLEYLALLGH